MPQRTLKIFVENSLYKEIVVDTTESGGYAVTPILEMIAKDKAAGLLSNIPGYNPDHLSIRVELPNRR